MATGRASTPNRPRGTAVRTDEKFTPISEWKQDDDQSFALLKIYLPGFMKDNIRVTTEGVNTVRVSGDRLISGNKYQKFHEDFQVPADCNIRGIRARFAEGVLTLSMPKKPSEPIKGDQAAEATTTTTRHKEQRSTGEDAAVRKLTDTATTGSPLPENKQKQTANQGHTAKEAAPKPRVSSETKVQKLPAADHRPAANETEMTMKKTKDDSAAIGDHKEKQASDGHIRRSKVEVRHKVGGKKDEKAGMVTARESVIGEERQLIVNVGVAAAVLLAFGAYLAYTFISSSSSSGKPSQ